jgi:hypothetical protein
VEKVELALNATIIARIEELQRSRRAIHGATEDAPLTAGSKFSFGREPGGENLFDFVQEAWRWHSVPPRKR